MLAIVLVAQSEAQVVLIFWWIPGDALAEKRLASAATFHISMPCRHGFGVHDSKFIVYRAIAVFMYGVERCTI